MKHEGYVLEKLDQYLLTEMGKDEDRRWDINSPSMASQCARAIYYSRRGIGRDSWTIDARTQRIFDNGTHVHLRIQDYLLKQGMLLMDEVPVFDVELKMQGHADGILGLTKFELGVLEIKSMNSNNFNQLMDAKEEHKYQAQCYMLCLERQRQKLKKKYPTKLAFTKYLRAQSTRKFYEGLYSHLKTGSKYTREEKLAHKVAQHITLDKILWNTSRPLTKMVFIYESKDTQEMKEFVVKWDDKLVKSIIAKFTAVNKAVVAKKLPEREGKNKSCATCRWCNFKTECFGGF